MGSNKLKKALKGFVRTIKAKNVVPVQVTTIKSEVLKGKVALISGGSGGIGFGIAKSFVSNGCKVILSGTNENKLANACKELGGDTVAKHLVINMLEVSAFADKIETAAGLFEENRIDILVNSAGVHGGGSFLDANEEKFDKTIDINLKGTFFMCQQMGKYMIKNKIKGHILNVSSASALKPAWTPYEISKWGTRGFTMGAASSLIKHGIVVNAIGPGPVATAMLGRSKEDTLYFEDNPAKRYATPEEIGELAVYMASDLGNLIVGDTFYITGGSGTVTYK